MPTTNVAPPTGFTSMIATIQFQLTMLTESLDRLSQMMSENNVPTTPLPEASPKRRQFSAATRRKMSAQMKQRWQKIREAKAQAATSKKRAGKKPPQSQTSR